MRIYREKNLHLIYVYIHVRFKVDYVFPSFRMWILYKWQIVFTNVMVRLEI